MHRAVPHSAAIAGLLAALLPSPHAAAQVVINEVMASNLATVPDMVDFGDFEDWIELHNAGLSPVDLGGYGLADDAAVPVTWVFPAGTVVEPGGFLLVWADGGNDHPGSLHTRPWWPAGQTFTTRRHHADFRLDQDGEGVYLVDPQGALADSVTFGRQRTDVSIGRFPDGSPAWRAFAEATPGAPNTGAPLTDPSPAPAVTAEPAGGFFSSPLQVTLDAGPTHPPVHYTLDGSAPTSASPVYASPIPVAQTTVVRTRAIVPGRLPGPVTTRTYFVAEPRTLPVVSVSANPAWLWDRDLGIYLNSYKEREIPVGFEYFPDGEPVLSVTAGARIGGENIYRFAQKPLNVYFRSEYGAPRLDWPVFDDLPYFEYKRLYVRNGGDDWPETLLRDGLVRELLKGRVGNAMQAFRPAVMYLNGAYWGIHNLREKIDERWFELHHGVMPADLDHLEADGTVIAGDSTAFMALLDFARTRDLSDPAAFALVAAQVDLDDLADFVAVQSIIANPSWGHNREVWRDRGSDGRWRWVIVDADRGFDMARVQDPTLQDLVDAFDLFRAALADSGFRERFIRRLAVHLNATFGAERVVATVDSLRGLIAPEIPRHAGRWAAYIDSLTIDIWGKTPGIQSAEAWESDVDEIRTFAATRPDIVRGQAAELFGLDGTARLVVRSEPPDRGRVRVEGEAAGEGEYFLGIPVALDATAPPGLAFVHWLERSLGTSVPLVPAGSAWRYLDAGTAPEAWAEPGFDDGSWPEGAAELGYGDGDEQTVLSFGPNPLDKRITYYFRARFPAPDPVGLAGLDLGLLVDDGAVVYLNGTELLREGMPPGTIDPLTRASVAVSGYGEALFHRYALPADLLVDGENVLAVEVHQVSRESSDISFDLELQARYVYGEPIERVASTAPAFDYVPTADAELVAVFEPAEANLVPASIETAMLLERARSPYYVEGEVVVAAGGALEAEAGVEVLMAPGSGIRVNGRLAFFGTADLPVRIAPLYPGERWGTVCIVGGDEWSELDHVELTGSGPGAAPCPAALTAVDTRVRLRAVTFDDVHLPVKADGSELEILDSVFRGVTGVGDYVEANGGRLVIEGSEFVGNDLVDMDAVDIGFMQAGTVIRGNVIRDFTGFNSDGVDLGDASVDILVEGNRIHDCQDKAVSVGQGSSVVVSRNVIARCGMGVGVKDSLSTAAVVHSTFHDTGIGVAVFEKNPEHGGASASVVSSLFSRSATAAVQADELSTLSVRFSLSDTDDLPGEGNLRADPRLVNPDGLGAWPQVMSPAIDAGDPALPPDPDGSRADIGALPFAGSTDAPVVINEITYNASAAFDTDDWVELHNPSYDPIELAGWALRDESADPAFVFPDGAVLEGRGYLVLSRRPDLFGPLFPWPGPPFGTMLTGLGGGGEGIWLYDAAGRMADSVRYGDSAPWPSLADGGGASLELVDPLLDNALASSWTASVGHGTPGWRNSTFVGAEDRPGDGLPTEFVLEQGFPNPFNPSTRIRYRLPVRSRVELRAYDALGRLVRTLVDGDLDAGHHETVWNADHLSSGVYFLSMRARPLGGGPEWRAARRAVLLK